MDKQQPRVVSFPVAGDIPVTPDWSLPPREPDEEVTDIWKPGTVVKHVDHLKYKNGDRERDLDA